MLTVSRPTETDGFLSAAPVVLTYAPEDRGRGRTRAYRVTIGGYQPHTEGTRTWDKFTLDHITIEVPDSGPFGWGTKDAIAAHLEQHHPGMTALDWWPLMVQPTDLI